MDGWIQQSDHGVFRLDGVGNIDVTAKLVQEPPQCFGDDGFTVAWRTIDEDRLSAAHGWSEFRQQSVADNHVFHRLPQCGWRTIDCGDRLPKTLFAVLFQTYRSRSDIPAFFERFARSPGAKFRQVEAIGRRTDDIAGRNLNRLLRLQGSQRFIYDREREPDVSSDLHAQQASVQIEFFQDKFADLH